MKILLKIKSDDKYITECNEKGQLFFEDGTKLVRKNFKKIEIECDSCNKSTIWKSVPDRKYLMKSDFFCRSCRQIGEKNNQFGKKWEEERKIKRSNQMIGDKNHMYGKSFYDIWIEKYGEEKALLLLEDHKNKSRKTGKENGMYAKSFYDVWLEKYGEDVAKSKLIEFKFNRSQWLLNNPEHHNKMIINSHLKKYRKTSIEKKVELYLKEKNIDFKYNFILDNLYQFDFLIKDMKLIIETHGDYWHANPLFYSENDPLKRKINETQRYKINQDNIKSKYAIDKGYKLISIWETDIKNENFKKFLNNYGIY